MNAAPSESERDEWSDLEAWPGSLSQLLEAHGVEERALPRFWDGSGPISWLAGLGGRRWRARRRGGATVQTRHAAWTKTAARIEADAPTFDRDRKHPESGVGENEVDFPLARFLPPIGDEPRHAVQRDEIIFDVVAPEPEDAALGRRRALNGLGWNDLRHRHVFSEPALVRKLLAGRRDT
jgi:hypothetical protein